MALYLLSLPCPSTDIPPADISHVPPLPQCQHQRAYARQECANSHITGDIGSIIPLSWRGAIIRRLSLTALTLLLFLAFSNNLSDQAGKAHFILPKVKDTEYVLEEAGPDDVQSDAADTDDLGRDEVGYAYAFFCLIHEVAAVVEEGVVCKRDPKVWWHGVTLYDIDGEIVVPDRRRVEQGVDWCDNIVR